MPRGGTQTPSHSLQCPTAEVCKLWPLGSPQPTIVFVKTVLLEHDYGYLPSSGLWLLCRAEQRQLRPRSLQTLSYLLCGPFLEKFANPCPTASGSHLWLTLAHHPPTLGIINLLLALGQSLSFCLRRLNPHHQALNSNVSERPSSPS